jgi:hypothetical protein
MFEMFCSDVQFTNIITNTKFKGANPVVTDAGRKLFREKKWKK